MIHFAGEKSSLVQSDLFSTWQSFIWGFLLNCQGSKVKFWYSKTWLFSAKDEYNSILCHFAFSVLIVMMTLTKNITFFFTNTRLNLSHYQPWLQLLICLSFYYMNTSSSWCLSEKRSSHTQDTLLLKKTPTKHFGGADVVQSFLAPKHIIGPKSKKAKM